MSITGLYIAAKEREWPKCPSPDEWVNKFVVAYPYDEIVFGDKKEWTMRYYMGEPWKHTEWEKPDTRDHVLHDSTYMKDPE